MENVGKQLIAYREKNRLSQNQMGVLIGISGAQVGNIEKGAPTRQPVLEKIQSILDDKKTTVDSVKSENWYQSEITRLNQTIEMLVQSIKNLSGGNLGKFDGRNELPGKVVELPYPIAA